MAEKTEDKETVSVKIGALTNDKWDDYSDSDNDDAEMSEEADLHMLNLAQNRPRLGELEHVGLSPDMLAVCILSGNFLKSIDVLACCRQLLLLDVSRNKLAQLPGIEFWANFQQIKVLYLHDNMIVSLDSLHGLTAADKLQVLTAYGNTFSLGTSYRHIIVNTVCTLRALDNHVIADEEITNIFHCPPRFAALSESLRLKLYKPTAPTTNIATVLQQMKCTLSAVTHILAHHSPVIIIQRYLRGWLARVKYHRLIPRKQRKEVAADVANKRVKRANGTQSAMNLRQAVPVFDPLDVADLSDLAGAGAPVPVQNKRQLQKTLTSLGVLDGTEAKIPSSNLSALVSKHRAQQVNPSNSTFNQPAQVSQLPHRTAGQDARLATVAYTTAPFTEMVCFKQQCGQQGRAEHYVLDEERHTAVARELDEAKEKVQKAKGQRQTDADRFKAQMEALETWKNLRKFAAAVSQQNLLQRTRDMKRSFGASTRHALSTTPSSARPSNPSPARFSNLSSIQHFLAENPIAARHQQATAQVKAWRQRHDQLVQEARQNKQRLHAKLTNHLTAVRSTASCTALHNSTARSRAQLFACELGAVTKLFHQHDLRTRRDSQHDRLQAAVTKQTASNKALKADIKVYQQTHVLVAQAQRRDEKEATRLQLQQQAAQQLHDAQERVEKYNKQKRMKKQALADTGPSSEVMHSSQVFDFTAAAQQAADRPVIQRTLYIRSNPNSNHVRRMANCTCHTPVPRII